MYASRKSLFVIVLTLLFCPLLFVTTASAGSTVQIQLTGAGGAEYGLGPNQADGEYLMPYYVSINNAAPIAVICDDYDHTVSIGDQWTGIISNFSNLSLTRFGIADSTQYHEAAWIASQISSTSSLATIAAAQFAIWSLFANDVPNVPGESLWLTNSAIAAAHSFYGMSFAGWEVLTPTNPASPQEYIFYVPIPEPHVMFDLGAGLLCLVCLLYAPRRRASLPADRRAESSSQHRTLD
jgi:hypothetical protein